MYTERVRRWILRISICLILSAIIAIAGAWGLSYYWFTKDKAATELDGLTRIVVDQCEDGTAVSGVLSRFGSRAVMTTWYTVAPDVSDFTATFGSAARGDRRDLPYWSRARTDPSRGGPEQERAFGFPFMCMSYQIDVLMPDEKQALREGIRRRRRDALMSGESSSEELADLRDAERAEWDALSRNFAIYIGGKEYDGTRQVTGTTTRYTYGAWPLRPIWPGLIANALCWGGLLFLFFFGPGIARRLIRRRRGACPKCGYLLRGAYDAGCPECGWNREGSETKRRRDGVISTSAPVNHSFDSSSGGGTSGYPCNSR